MKPHVSNENFRRRSLSGWQVTNRTKKVWAVMPEMPTRWHRMLYALGVEEKAVQTVTGDKRKKIVEWARRNVDSCYIPTFILEDAKIHCRYDS